MLILGNKRARFGLLSLRGLDSIGMNKEKKFSIWRKRHGSITSGGGLQPMWLLIGLAIALAVIAVVAGLSILPTGASAGLISATTEIVAFLAIIGLGIAVGLLDIAFKHGRM